jgi:alpha-1,3-rhamnosyl/mannosyltransferase
MKVALDATPLTVWSGGIARYTQELHRALATEFPEDEYTLVTPEPGRWWSTGLPRHLRADQFDLFHGTNYEVPVVPVVRSVMTLHDLSPWKNEPWRAPSSRVRRRTPWLLRLGLAAIVVTPTEAIRKEAIDHFRLRADRVVAAPEAASAIFHPGDEPPERFLLCVGTGPRKNLEVAREAARQTAFDLIVVGRGEREAEDEELAELYRRAWAVLYPSFYEGFGLPILEAMQSGTPVVASRDPALCEVSGGAVLHADAHDVKQWIESIQELERHRQVWRDRALKRACEFSWAKTAHRMKEVYREALR